MDILTSRSELEMTTTIMTKIYDNEFMKSNFTEKVLLEAANLIARRIVEEKFQEIMATIDIGAIANLSIAESAAAISRTLKEKIPDKILEIHKVTEKP